MYWLDFDESGHFCHFWQDFVERKLTAMTVLLIALVLLTVALLVARTPRRTDRRLDHQLADLAAMRSYRQYP